MPIFMIKHAVNEGSKYDFVDFHFVLMKFIKSYFQVKAIIYLIHATPRTKFCNKTSKCNNSKSVGFYPGGITNIDSCQKNSVSKFNALP